MARRMLYALAAGVGLLGGVGCCTTCGYDPQVRQDQLIERSEDLRQIEGKNWKRPSVTDQPELTTPVRIHGSIT